MIKASVIALLLVCGNAFAQRPVLTEADAVVAEVTKEIGDVFKSADFIKKKNKSFPDVSGTIVIDIGVIQNGKVSTFYKVESDIRNSSFINFVSEYVLKHRFRFKLPKQQRYKVRYVATF